MFVAEIRTVKCHMNAFGFATLKGPGLINKLICDKFEYYNAKEVDFTMWPDSLSGFMTRGLGWLGRNQACPVKGQQNQDLGWLV